MPNSAYIQQVITINQQKQEAAIKYKTTSVDFDCIRKMTANMRQRVYDATRSNLGV